MVHHLDQQHHQPHGDAHRIASELLSGHHTQARHELTAEFMHNPREAQRLLHQIGGELRAHGYRGIGVELDRHHNVTHVDFNHHNIYSGLGHGDYHPYQGHHYRQEGHHHGSLRHHQQHQQEESFAPPSRERREREHPHENPENPFTRFGHEVEHKLDRAGHVIGDVARKVGDGIGDAAREVGHDLDRLQHEIGDKMARMAVSVAQRLGTTGDCAHGPRLVLDRMGFHMPPMMATSQGAIIRNSGMFDEVSEKDARPGDYCVRNWSKHVIRQHGYNAGDSSIVVSNHHGNIVQANDHIQNLDRGSRYADKHFYHPNAKFYAMMKEKGLI